MSLWLGRSFIAAIASESGARKSVGPKTTPKLWVVIRFLSWYRVTLQE